MLDYNLRDRGEASLYEYLYQCIRLDIETGVIAPHEHMPSKRSFAEHLGVSVITVENAYAQLVAEGYLYTKPRSGFYASALPDAPAARTAVAKTRAEVVEYSAGEAAPSLNRETPPLASTDAARLWSKALRTVLATESEAELYAPSPAQGTLRLRKAIADHLRRSRGMHVDPANIVVGAGAQVLDMMLVQMLSPASSWAVEDPGYLRITNLYRAMGVNVCHVPLDANGICVAELVECDADVLHIMPSHQFPTGVVTSIARRYELLGWAAARVGRYIIEDDYDCEFRLAGRPIPTLQSIDTTGSAIYTNTFSKSLSSALRLAYMVLPEALMERYNTSLSFYSSTVSTVQQSALAWLLESGEYERHVNRMRKRARDRRDELVDALELSVFDGKVAIEAPDAGLHILVAADSGCDEEELREYLATFGAEAIPLSSFAWNPENVKYADGRTRFLVQL